MRKPPLLWQELDGPGPPRCLRCAYVLEGLEESRCPECGQEFNIHNPETYTTKPPFLGWKFWLPGFALALIGGTLGFIVLLGAGNWGWPLWFAVPFAAGSLLGYRVRCQWFIIGILMISTIAGLIFGMMTLNIAGVFCGFALVGIFLGPVFLGTVLGAILRFILKQTRFSQRWHLPLLVILIFPLICAWLDGPPVGHLPVETVETSIVIPAPAAQCWDAIMFYEEIEHQAPLILRIGLARPLYTQGRSSHVGDVKTCVYNKGRIVKQTTDVQPRELLAFKVIQQQIGYERDVRLVGGSFVFESLSSDQTRVTLTTQYEPLLQPRWCWRPFEQFAVHTLHGHVLEGMRRNTQHHEVSALAIAENADAHRD